MSILYDKKRPGLLGTRISLLFLVLCSCFLIAELQSSVSLANEQSKSQVSDKSTKMAGPKVYMPELLKPGVADKLISLDFDQVDIKIFIKTIGELTGINFLIDDSIRGTVTLISPTQIRLGEVYEVFESVLQVKGFAAVPAGKIVKIIPRAEASKSNILIRVGSDPELIPQNDAVVTQIIPIRFANIAEISSSLTPLVSTGGNLTTYVQSNSIILTDTSSNIHRMAKLIQELDTEGAKENIVLLRLQYGSANTISEQIKQIMEQSAVASGGRVARAVPPGAGATLKILPDERTNSLIVLANPDDTEIIRGLVNELDVERPVEAGNVHVIYLNHAEAADVEKSLSKVLGQLVSGSKIESREPLQITADESTNSLIVVASSQYYRIVEDIIGKLDVVREQVLVEFQIIEVSEEVLKEIGVDWATLDQAIADSVRGFALTNLGPRVEAASGDLEGLAIGLHKEVGGQVTIGAVLKALEKQAGVNILSTPHVLTSNHQEATIIVADNVPYVRDSRVTEIDPATPTKIQTYDFKDVGIELTVTPHISPGDYVRLEVDASFSKLVPSAATGVISGDTPTTATRDVKTVISIPGGATVVIGGLIRDDKETLEKKIPLLGDIPLIGGLFRVDRDRVQKTNLLLFITPHVLTTREAIEQITELKKRQTLEPKASFEEELSFLF
ncbi:MAG: type II secretion system secretin GspD [Planctomycetes bacterium]|nr:type II secretion system secretin GspD [Planctomycetota bacterium]MBL7146172.1 type II secretion system secretin GspD [Phycisphaerae bacterium]